MDLSIIVCTHNRAQLLLQTLESLRAVAWETGLEAEILVVANACSDRTTEMLASLAVQWPAEALALRWLEEPRAGKSFALNAAIQATHSSMLCFIDDDQIVTRDYLLALADVMTREPCFGIYCGWMHPAWDGSEPPWVHVRGEYMIPVRPFPEYDLGEREMEVVAGMKNPSGGNIAVRREVFAAIEKNSRGRFRIIYNAALQQPQDYYVDFKIESSSGDRLRMPAVFQDVLRDLIGNARKYTAVGGHITAALHEDPTVLRLLVEDTGRGIPPDELAKVVHFGQRASNVGNVRTMGGGFGLTKAFLATKQFGGRFWLASELGVGTRVRIHVPRPAADSAGA